MGILITTLLVIVLAGAISFLVGGLIATIFSAISTVIYYVEQSSETKDAESILNFWSTNAKNLITTMCFLILGTLFPVKLSDLAEYLNTINPLKNVLLNQIPPVPVALFILSFLGAVLFTGYFLKLASKIMWAHAYDTDTKLHSHRHLKHESAYRKRVLPK